MKKRNKKDSAVSLPEETKAPETSSPAQEPDDPVEDVNRALTEALSSSSGEAEPAVETDSAFSKQLSEVPALEQDEPLLEIADDEELPPEEGFPKETADRKKAADSPAAAVLRITLPLTIICIAVSLMLAVVNLLTADIISGNAAKEKENAVRAIFAQAETVVPVSGEDGTEVYLAVRGTEILGSCVGLSENGFGGAISLMVGLDSAGSVCGVRIVSMSETPGFGTRAKNDSFLAGFSGRDPFVIGENFDALSGATITSKAVVAGVNRAMASMPDLQAEAAQRGLTVAAAAQPDTEVPKENPTVTAPAEPEKPTEEPTETESVAAVVVPSPLDTAPLAEDTASIASVNLAAVMPSETIAFRSAAVNRVTVVSAETVYVAETEEPVEPEPVEPEPVETEPVETEPVEPEPVETEPVETEPVETEPVETEPVETEPVEPEPVETEPVETEPVETEPVETEPAETEPVETRPIASGI